MPVLGGIKCLFYVGLNTFFPPAKQTKKCMLLHVKRFVINISECAMHMVGEAVQNPVLPVTQDNSILQVCSVFVCISNQFCDIELIRNLFHQFQNPSFCMKILTALHVEMLLFNGLSD